MKTKVTTDIYFAALLLAVGAKLEKTDKEDPRHMEFHFSTPDAQVSTSPMTTTVSTASVLDLDKMETEWVNGSYMVNAFAFAEAIKRMKSVVHSRPSVSR